MPLMDRGSAHESGWLHKLRSMEDPDRIAGHFIVRFFDDTSDPEGLARELVSQHGGSIVATLYKFPGFWGELPDRAVEMIATDSRVRYVEADVAARSTGVGDTVQMNPTGPLDRMDQPYLPLNGTYEWSTDGTGVHIWIVDNGVDANDPEFLGRVSTAHSATRFGQNPLQSCVSSSGANDGHGTFVARVAAGRTVGIARNAIVHSARVNTINSSEMCNSFSNAAIVLRWWSARAMTRQTLAARAFRTSRRSSRLVLWA